MFTVRSYSYKFWILRNFGLVKLKVYDESLRRITREVTLSLHTHARVYILYRRKSDQKSLPLSGIRPFSISVRKCKAV